MDNMSIGSRVTESRRGEFGTVTAERESDGHLTVQLDSGGHITVDPGDLYPGEVKNF
jgi:hypothetical protein